MVTLTRVHHGYQKPVSHYYYNVIENYNHYYVNLIMCFKGKWCPLSHNSAASEYLSVWNIHVLSMRCQVMRTINGTK